MIRFPCRCGQPLDVPASEAGGAIQCPVCGKLNDVPGLDDLAQIDRDGGYKVADDRPAADGRRDTDRSRQTIHALKNGGRDAHGRSRDLRPSIDEFLRAGTTADVPVEAETVRSRRPKYDPLTGELVRPLGLAAERPVPAQAVRPDPSVPGGKRRLTYANRETPGTSVPPRRLPMELFNPGNVTVMFFVFAFLCIQLFALRYIPVQLFVAGFIFFACLSLAVVAHFGNVVEETGPGGKDELPAPLRDLNFGADIWSPAVHVLFAVFTCVCPGLFALLYVLRLARWGQTSAVPTPVWLGVGAVLLAVGAAAFPAMLLTATTAGSAVANASPPRLIGTIRACGWDYLISLILLAVAAPTLAAGLYYGATSADLPFGWQPGGRLGDAVGYLLGLPMLAAGVYLSHLFCWHLGLLYRLHHERFPWLFQRFEGGRDDAMKQLETRRAESRAAAREKSLEDRLARLSAEQARPPRRAQPVRPVEPMATLPVEPLED